MLVLSRNIFKTRLLNYKVLTKRNKYYVLLPEIPKDTAETNSLLRHTDVPLFGELTPDNCVNAIAKLVIQYESGIHSLDQKLYDSEVQPNVQNIILPLDSLSAPLDFAWGAFKVLYSVNQKSDLAQKYMRAHPRIVQAKREKYLSLEIFKAFKDLKKEEKSLTEPVRRIIDKHLLESRLFGMDLSEKDYAYFQVINSKIEEQRNKYKQRLTESSSKFSHDLEFKDVRNFPKDLLRLLAADPINAAKGPWKLTLNPYIYQYFLKHCDDRLLRWNAWYAYNVRASSMSGAQLNNSIVIEELRYQRSELAKLFDCQTYAELSMKTKMAGSVENVLEMITTLHVKSKSVTAGEIKELQTFAGKHGFNHELEVWDLPYWQRLHKEELFNVDDDIVRQYFPLPAVLEGVFKMCRKLFNITIKESQAKTEAWHEDVRYFEILDETGKQFASFFLDPYSREGKIQASLMEIGRNRSDVIGSEPLAYLIFNFPAPAYGKPSLLSFTDLTALLSKFGHLLQHSLTTIPYNEAAGINNLEWDIVNVCPLVMSFFLRHYGTVACFSSHLDSGKVLPPELHENLVKREQYMKGLQLAEELYLSALDLELYSSKEFWYTITKNVWEKYMPFPFHKDTAHACSFSEIFSEHYPAAYFSNLWAKMIAADIFSAFEEEGLDDEESMQVIGQRFRDTFLALGGGCHPGEVFRKFRGRDPSTDALLVNYGLASKSTS